MQSSTRAIVLVWLFTAIFLPTMIGLGLWQLDRADDKSARLIELAKQSALPERLYLGSGSGSELVVDANPIKRFEPRALIGRYKDKHLLLDNRQYKGRVGYELLSVFETQQGQQLLINRGWIAAPRYRSELPKFSTPRANQRLRGYFYWTDKPTPKLGDIVEAATNNVMRIQVLDWPAIARWVGQEFTEERTIRLASNSEPGAHKIVWQYKSNGPEKHEGYAVQWFAMSLALFVLACWSSVRISRGRITENKNKE